MTLAAVNTDLEKGRRIRARKDAEGQEQIIALGELKERGENESQASYRQRREDEERAEKALDDLLKAAEEWVNYLDGPCDGEDDAELEQCLMQNLRDAVKSARA